MKKITLEIVNGFVDNDRGGNPAGLLLHADGFSSEEKQAIAAKTGLSETAFVSASSVADFKFDFYTPVKQIAHCGHATIAAFSYMRQSGLLKKMNLSKETIDGIRKIVLIGDNAFMEQKAPVYTQVQDDLYTILFSLGLEWDDLAKEATPCVVNTGNSFLMVPVKDTEILKKIRYDTAHVSSISEKFDLIGYYVFSLDTVMPGRDATARMFGPWYGIPEESATGMAAGPLACYLYDKLKIKKTRFLVEQGHFMNCPSPSLIIVELDIENDQIKSLMAGGKGMPVKTIEVEI